MQTRRFRVLLGLMAAASIVTTSIAAFAVTVAVTADDPDPLIDEWDVRFVGPVVIGEPIELEGLFVCSAQALEQQPTVQFRASLRAVNKGWEVPRPVLAARPITGSCNTTGGYIQFVSPWPADADAFAEPDQLVSWRVSVEADGWATHAASTDPAPLIRR